MSQPTDDKPYRKYRARRLRTHHAGSGDVAHETDKVREPPAPGQKAVKTQLPSDRPVMRRRFRWRYLVLAILAILTIAGVLAGIWAYRGYSQLDKAVKKSNRRIDRATRRALTPDAGSLLRHPTTILVLGSDARDNEPSRSDSILLMRFNPEKHTVSQLSIARDTLTSIEGHGETKINEAFFWGGAPLAIKTVSQYIGIPINHIMLVRFRGFRKLINGVGGLTVNVPEDVSSVYIGGRIVHFKKGQQVMDGDEALIYARIRKSDDDFHRMARQQQVVQALEKQIASTDNLLDLPQIGSDFMRGLRTELTTNELLALAYLQWRTDPKHVYKYVLEGTSQTINGGSYVIVDPAVKERTVRQFLAK